MREHGHATSLWTIREGTAVQTSPLSSAARILEPTLVPCGSHCRHIHMVTNRLNIGANFTPAYLLARNSQGFQAAPTSGRDRASREV